VAYDVRVKLAEVRIGGFLGQRWWEFEFQKRGPLAWRAKRLSASRERIYFVLLLSTLKSRPAWTVKAVPFLTRDRKTAKSDYWLLHICLSLRLCAWNFSAPTDAFSWILIFEFFVENLLRNSIFIKISQEKKLLYMKTYVYLWQYLA
jgi:hypothetical protein